MLERLGSVLALASLFSAPPIGIEILKGAFRGNIMDPITAMGVSIVAALVLVFTTLIIMVLATCAMDIFVTLV